MFLESTLAREKPQPVKLDLAPVGSKLFPSIHHAQKIGKSDLFIH